MTHQNHQTNGASLEDCHTNFFALTDLCGIKWRKFVNGERPNASSDPLDDPILRSYSRCMQADILCVWRRVQSTKQENSDPNALPFEINSSKVHPPLSLAAAKELWIFWYGEEPDLNNLVDADLLRVAANQTLWNGTWERGLTYECRSLLFKALHNLMERFVLTKDIVRFGKWFVQPCNTTDRLFGNSSQHLSFSFTFFVHGDTVCASIDLREHPAVRPLTKEHLIEAASIFAAVSSSSQPIVQSHDRQPHASNQLADPTTGADVPDGVKRDIGCGNATLKPRKVILAPFGMAAILTGNSYKASDPITEKILEDWSSFFPLCNRESSDVPPVVEVISGGHKMYHPSTYVLITDLDDLDEMESVGMHKEELNTIPPPQIVPSASLPTSNGNDKNFRKFGSDTKSTVATTLTNTMTVVAQCFNDRTKYPPYYDSLVNNLTCNSINTHAPPQAATEMSERAWQNCITNTLQVSYSNTRRTTGNALNSNHLEDDSNIDGNSYNSNLESQNPSQFQQSNQVWGFFDPTQKAPCVCTKGSPIMATPQGTPHGGASTYSRNSVGDSLAVPSVGSPNTPAPSPHPNSISQPTSVPPTDQLLTMSPHAPASVSNVHQPSTPIDHLLEKNTPAPTPTDLHDHKSIAASPYVQLAPGIDAPASTEGIVGINFGSVGPGSVPQSSSNDHCTTTITQQHQHKQPPNQSQSQLTYEPTLPQCDLNNAEVHHSLTQLTSDIKVDPDLANQKNNQNSKAKSGLFLSEEMREYLKLYKAPKLNVKDIDSFANEDYLKLDVLYDFNDTEAWLNHATKRFKPNEVIKQCRTIRTKNLYEGHTHFKPLMPSPDSLYGAQFPPMNLNTNLCNTNTNGANGNVGTVGKGLVGISNNNAMEVCGSDNESIGTTGFFQDVDVKSEAILRNKVTPCKEVKSSIGGNLYTAEGLNPSLNDLEQLFETSSNDECNSIQIHTPPDSNNSNSVVLNTIDELKRNNTISALIAPAVSINSNNCTPNTVIGSLHSCAATANPINSNVGSNVIQVEELTKMFPTPPSHEHHPNSSPCQVDVQMTDISVLTASNLIASLDTNLPMGSIIKIKQEYSVELGSPVEEPIEDWSYVFKPPQQAKFVGSTKYAPLTNLYSQTIPQLFKTPNSIYEPSWVKQQQNRTVNTTPVVPTTQPQQHTQQPSQKPSLNHIQKPSQDQLHDLLTAAPRPSLQQSRIPTGIMPMGMQPNAGPHIGSGGTNLLLNQLNCPPAALNSVSNNSPTMQQILQRTGLSPISPAPALVSFSRGSPMLQPNRQTPIHPPPPYEIAVASPATSTSSYLNKQFNSQEPPQTPQSIGIGAGGPLGDAANLVANGLSATISRELPEVSSLIVNILLYDTALNVFRDHNFDSSTVCVCNADSQKIGNIRGADSGVYVPLPGSTFNPTPTPVSSAPGATGMSSNLRMLSAFSSGGGSLLDSPASLPGAGSGHLGSSSSSSTATSSSNQHITGYVDEDPVDCTCGFSAVVNRRLAHRAGLFYEDEMEITGIAEDPSKNKKISLVSLINSLSKALNSSSMKTNNALVSINTEKPLLQADQQVHAIFDLLLEQCPSIIQTSSSSIHRALQRYRRRLSKQNIQPQSSIAVANVLEYVDANDIMCLALEQARLAFENSRMEVNEFNQQHQLSPYHSTPMSTNLVNRRQAAALFGSDKVSVHKWPYIPVGFSRSNKDIVRTMNSIQPMLQNAFHSKSRNAAGAKDATYTVSGPLTWRQFHRLAGRASGQCEPQPIPSVIVGHDKDWISVAPLAIHYWDKFLLEPYSYARDVVYLIMCPDNEYIVNMTKVYFKELSNTYEMCKLGRHTPMRGCDGVLTIGPRASNENSSTWLDEWLRTLDDNRLAEKIRLYASTFQNILVPYLNRIASDKSLLNPNENTHNNSNILNSRDRISTSPMMTSSILNSMHPSNNVIDLDKTMTSPKLDHMSNVDQGTDNNMADGKSDVKSDAKPILLGDPLGINDTMEDINPPAIVLYVVEPFSFGSDSPELERLACIVLLRCYSELLKNIPESVRANLNIQIISLESILELGCNRNRKRFSDEVKCLALNIFSQCRRHMVHAQTVKSLTGFGTAANMEIFLKSKDENNRQPYKMYTPPYILAPIHEKNDKTDFTRTTGIRSLNEQKYSVMYCNYCMSEDQSWLLATVTDDRGELLEKVCINIDVPSRSRRQKVPVRRIGLKKLMDFILGLISQTAQPWRLVVGRIGRIGHSELKSWSYLLSKQNLQKVSKQLKDICKQCTLTYSPSILSACLVTLEPDAKLRVMPDQFTPDERFSQISMQNPLSTPQDVTCTHILVFPTSAVCLSFTRQFQNEPPVEFDNDFLNFDECEDENEAFPDADIMSDLFWDPGQLGRMSNHGSPDRLEDNRSWQSAGGNNFNSAQQLDVEEVGSINQQPLAVGYLVSTAPTGRMPSWFWAACPHLEDVCPVFLKTALHLHIPNIQTTDDILNSTNAHSSATDHPLDSILTADVLRFVLEGYNALSWLALDSNTHDRLSCLPINVQTLMDLYYLTAAIA